MSNPIIQHQFTFEKLLPVMLDLETLSTEDNAGILSLGATIIGDPDGNKFYQRIDIESLDFTKFHKSVATMEWWAKQSKEARDEAFSGTIDIGIALDNFADWVKSLAGGKEVLLFGNGATFDNIIISNAMNVCNVKVPWKFTGDMCYRTITRMFPALTREAKSLFTNSLAHSAIADAVYQAQIAEYIFTKLASKGIILWE